jgi:hypothetical protein
METSQPNLASEPQGGGFGGGIHTSATRPTGHFPGAHFVTPDDPFNDNLDWYDGDESGVPE